MHVPCKSAWFLYYLKARLVLLIILSFADISKVIVTWAILLQQEV